MGFVILVGLLAVITLLVVLERSHLKGLISDVESKVKWLEQELEYAKTIAKTDVQTLESKVDILTK